MTKLEVDTSAPSPQTLTRTVSRDGARQRRGHGGGGRVRDSSAGGRRIWPYALGSLLCAVALIALGWAGYDTSLEIRGGAALNEVSDPAKPGYEARVKPTPTHLVIIVSDSGEVRELELLVGGAKGGGSVVFVPGLMVVNVDGHPYNLAELAEAEGVPKLVEVVQATLGIAVSDAVEIGPDELTELFASAGPLELDNADALRSGDEVRFPAGRLTLQPSDVPAYLAALNEGEPIVNRPFRAEQVWKAWMGKLSATSAPSLRPLPSVDGESTVDISSLAKALASGSVDFEQLPVDRLVVPNMGGFAVYQPKADAIAELMATVVPFPGSAFPGQRARVRLLNGTKDPTAGLRAARPIVAAGGQIVVMGNAASFDVSKTAVEYNVESQKPAAEAIAAALGVGSVGSGTESDAVDVTVVVGADFRG